MQHQKFKMNFIGLSIVFGINRICWDKLKIFLMFLTVCQVF